MLLDGRVCIVSGVGPGIGRAIAEAVIREGGAAVIAARSDAYLASVSAELAETGGRVVAQPTDITDEQACQDLVGCALESFGRVDVLLNNAAISSPYQALEGGDLDVWRRMYEVNLVGTLQMTRAALPVMRDQQAGSIVFINSLIIRKPRPNYGPYAASKAALLTSAQVLAREVGPAGIRVNSVCPGWVWGPTVVEGYAARTARARGITVDDVYAELAEATALHQLPTPEACADAAVFLASDMARAITGQSLDVNCGEVFV